MNSLNTLNSINCPIDKEIKDDDIWIGKYIACDACQMEKITVGKNVKLLQSAFMNCISLQTVEFEKPSKLKKIIWASFSGCTSLEKIDIPNSVTDIGSGTRTSDRNGEFEGCIKLSKIKLPENLKIISYKTFSDCESLTDITFPNTLESIGNKAFYNCTNLTNITLPYTLKSIGKNAFHNCTNLTNIIFPDTSESIKIHNTAFFLCGTENWESDGKQRNAKLNIHFYPHTKINGLDPSHEGTKKLFPYKSLFHVVDLKAIKGMGTKKKKEKAINGMGTKKKEKAINVMGTKKKKRKGKKTK